MTVCSYLIGIVGTLWIGCGMVLAVLFVLCPIFDYIWKNFIDSSFLYEVSNFITAMLDLASCVFVTLSPLLLMLLVLMRILEVLEV